MSDQRHDKGDHSGAQQDFDPYALLDTLRSGGDIDIIRESVELVLQALIDAEATAFIGAAPHERTDTLTATTTSGASPLGAGLRRSLV